MEIQKRISELNKRVDHLELEMGSIRKEISNILQDSQGAKVEELPKVEDKIIHPKEKPKPPQTKKMGSNFSLEFVLNILGKLGLVAIIIASALFVKYAFDNHWINESGRIYIGLLIGFFVSITSLFLAKKKYRILPGAIMGTGASIVYISILSAYHFYDLLNLKETFVYVAFLSIGMGFLANVSKQQLLYIFSFVGSILTPLLLSQGENSYRFLFSYLLIVNAIFLFVSYKNAWRFSPYIVLFTNLVLFDVWAASKIKVSSFLVPFVFLTLSYFFWIYREIVFMVRLRQKAIFSSVIFVFFVTLFYSTSGFWLVETFYPKVSAHFFLLIAAFSLLAYEIFYRKGINFLPSQDTSQKLMSSVLLICWTTSFFASVTDFTQGKWLTISWIAFAGTISVIGSFQKDKKILFVGTLFWLPALFRLYFIESGENLDELFLWNSRFALFFVASLFLFFTYYIQRKNLLHTVIKGYAFVALFTIILGTLIENRFLITDRYYRILGYSYVLVFYIVALLLPGFLLNSKNLIYSGIVVSIALIIKFYVYDIWMMSTLVQIIAGFSLGTGIVVMSIVFQKYRDKLTHIVKSSLILGFLLLPFVVPNDSWATPFKKKSYKFYKEVNLDEDELKKSGEKFGRILIDEEIMRFSGKNDRRLVLGKKKVPYFTREVITKKGQSGEVYPQVIYETQTDYTKTYLLKFPQLPTDSIYSKLYVSSNVNYEVGVQVSLGDKVDEWKYFEDHKLYHYDGNGVQKNTIEFKNGNFLYARLQLDLNTVSLSFPKAEYTPKNFLKEYKVELEKDEFHESHDVDINASVYYYDNTKHKPIKKLVLTFRDKWFDRQLKIYYKNNSKTDYYYMKDYRLYKTSKNKTKQVIDLDYSVYGKLKIQIENGDDDPLKLKTIEAFTPQEEIIFKIPNQLIEEKNNQLRLYYGNPYALYPKFDFNKSRLTGTEKLIKGNLGKHSKNEEFGYSLVEPPLSMWIIRAIYIIGILGMIYPSYKVLKRYSESV